jgi:SAM-dependent MidA family methyltransferase
MSPPAGPPTRGEGSDPLLLDVLRRRISERGPIPFSEFMEAALYLPGGGYYARPEDPVGRHEASDYYTAPSRHPAFGLLLGRQVAECLRHLGGGPAEVVEAGPGSGALFVSVLQELRKLGVGWPGNLRGTLVEANPGRAEAQRRRLEEAGFDRGIRWISPAEWENSPQRFRGCILANEVLDAMPVHRLVFQAGELREIYVDWKDGLVEVTGPISRSEIRRELDRQGFSPREGQEIEVGLEAIRWIRRVGGRLERGYAILADYGYPAPELFSPRHHRGTLLAYHRHGTSEEYLERVGFQDLTAHVNFTSVLDAARDSGLVARGPVSQGRFLLALGVLDCIWKPGSVFSLDEYRDRKALQDLFLPGGLGESHQVLILGTPELEMSLVGLRPPELWTAPAPEDPEEAGPLRRKGRNGAGSPRS